jgi:hypothetical protein
MDWRDALFLHWPVDAGVLRPLIPRDLDVDVMEGSAWIGIVAFGMAGVRARIVPRRLALRTFGEVNVRTYVTGSGGRRGVWFLSLDAASRATVAAGRSLLRLPYYDAGVTIARDGSTRTYRVERTDTRAAPARFAAQARFADDERSAARGSLEHALVERYWFFSVDRRGRTIGGNVLHPPWPLLNATVTVAENTLLAAAGIPASTEAPLVYASAGVATRARYPVAL